MSAKYSGGPGGGSVYGAAGEGAMVSGLANGWRRWREAVRSTLGRLKGTSWALADQSIVSAANFFTIYLFARHFDPASFGAFMLAYTGLLLLTSVQNALVIQPHNVLGAALPRPEYRQFTAALALMQGGVCVTVCAVLGVAGWLIARIHSPATGSILVALAIAAVPWLGQEFARRVLYTRGESRAAAINDLVSYGLQFLGALVLVWFLADHASPEAALFVLGGSSLAGALLGLWQLRDHVRIDVPEDLKSFRRTWSEVWNFGKWLLAQNMLVWFGSQGHSWVVGLMLGTGQVGLYRAATHLVNVMNPLLQTAYSYFPSRGSLAYHAGGAGGLSRWVRKTSWMLPVALMPFCIVLVGFPGEVLRLAYGAKYAGADLALILALATIAQCLIFSKFPFDIGLLALRATKSIFYVYLLPIVLLLTSGVGLIYFLGIMGVPLSAIIINSALLIATWFAYTRRMAQQEGDRSR